LEVNELWNEYKLPKLQNNCSIITADFGNLGSISFGLCIEKEKINEFISKLRSIINKVTVV